MRMLGFPLLSPVLTEVAFFWGRACNGFKHLFGRKCDCSVFGVLFSARERGVALCGLFVHARGNRLGRWDSGDAKDRRSHQGMRQSISETPLQERGGSTW